jgi:hypothetical protein
MKRKTYYNILGVLFIATIFFAACKKEEDVKLDPQLATTQVLNYTSSTATVVGFVVAAGDGFTEKGVCYNTATTPTVANSKAIYTGETKTATFNVAISNLAYATKYYVRAYATDANGVTIYGEEFTFTTLPVVPTLQTAAITEITGNSASSGGMVLVDGGALVTVHGVCFGTNPGPTIADSKTADGKAAGPYVSALTGLKGNTKYYVRAYATNSVGTGYGPEVFFETKVDVPKVTTTAVTNVTADGASSGGQVTDDGGASISVRGICWSTTANPTIADNKTSNGTGTGTFSSTLAALSVATTYHVRAYATNSAGTGYGNDVSFMTFPVALYALGDGTAAGWDNTKAVKIDQSATPGIYIGTLDLVADKSMKFISTLGQWQPQWGQAKGAALGTLGVNLGSGSDPDPITTPATAGNYKVTVDLGKMTYKIEAILPAAVYLIGDGVISGGHEWDWTVDLPMIPVNSHPNLFWKIIWMNGTGGFKINSAKAWDGNELGYDKAVPVGGVYNLGKAPDNNIPVPAIAGYYMVVADFATNKIAIADPKVYLIGNTINSWDTGNAAGLFTVDNANSLVTITKTLAADELRMYAWHPWFDQWWQSEFIILGGKIAFRGTGGDQTRVSVTAGSHKIDLNFKTGDGAVN